jgi:hypothetical protein
LAPFTLVGFVRRLHVMGSIADRLHGRNQLLDPRLRIAMNGGLLRGEVDGRLDTCELVELLLDPRRAGRAGHALEYEANLPRLCRGRIHQAAS